MKRTVLAAVAALALTSPALAGGAQMHCTHSKFYGTTCTLTDIRDALPPTEAEIAEQKAADEKWFEFCKPVGAPDNLGVIRLRYAHDGCEFGRSE